MTFFFLGGGKRGLISHLCPILKDEVCCLFNLGFVLKQKRWLSTERLRFVQISLVSFLFGLV